MVEWDILNWHTMIIELAIGLGIAGLVALSLYKREEKRQRKDREGLESLISQQGDLIVKQNNAISKSESLIEEQKKIIERQEIFRNARITYAYDRILLYFKEVTIMITEIEKNRELLKSNEYDQTTLEEEFEYDKKFLAGMFDAFSNSMSFLTDILEPELITKIRHFYYFGKRYCSPQEGMEIVERNNLLSSIRDLLDKVKDLSKSQ
ncbi:MAG: hypothetical protein GKS07_10390 [Nitrosopumilus sp.]|nr:MAG: hypothetical protein GKS07_10390 [Nitrosopumilus sp.]